MYSIVVLIATAALASAAATQQRNNVNRVNAWDLEHCPGRSIGDADACTFEKQGTAPDVTKWVVLGSPLANCEAPNSPPLTNTIGSSKSVSQTWEHTDSAEINLFGIKIGGEGGWSTENDQTVSQQVTVTADPGKQVAVVAGVRNTVSTGRIRINYGDPSGTDADGYHYIWYANDIQSLQPTSDVVYDQKEINCGDNFDPNNL